MKATTWADVSIIGAGISGLVAAAMLSKEGYKVAVLERDIHPGGCAANFNHNGFNFAVGATVAMGLEPGGLVRSIYEKLDLEARYVNVNPAIRVHLKDRIARVQTSKEAWFNELKAVFPGQDRAKEKFWQETSEIAKTMYAVSKKFPVMPFRHLDDLLDTAKAAHPNLIKLLPRLRQTVASRLEHYGIDDEVHNSFVDGQLLDAMQTDASACVATSGAFALDIYRYGCQYKIGGLASIAEDLAAYVVAQGGSVNYAHKVKAIHAQGNIKTVETNQGEFDSHVVISSAPLSNTAQLLTETESKLVDRAEAQAEMWGAFTMYLGIDERILPDDAQPYEQVTNLNVHDDTGNLLISTSPSWDQSRAPQGKRAITVSTHVNAKKWMQLASERGAYAEAKRVMEEQLLEQIERVFPKIKQGIEVQLSGSPRTFKRFTLRDGGTVGGFPQTLAAANFKAPSHRTDVAGLFLAGDTIFPGQGVLGTSVSGYNAARTAVRYLRKQNKTTQTQSISQPDAEHQENYTKELAA